MSRRLVSNPCRDACGTVATGEVFEGAPVYRCPGCDSTWVDEELVPSDGDADTGSVAAG